MIANDEKKQLLEKWQKKLCLQDWRINLVTHLSPEEMTLSNAVGCTDWSEPLKTARIEIMNPDFYGERIVPFKLEKTLVHELLHLKFSFWCQDECSVSDRLMHQYIDDLARAFTEENDDTVDAVPVVRCKDCCHSYDDIGGLTCSCGPCIDCIVPEDFYCKHGETGNWYERENVNDK